MLFFFKKPVGEILILLFRSILTRLLYNYLYINQTTERGSVVRFVIYPPIQCHAHILLSFTEVWYG